MSVRMVSLEPGKDEQAHRCHCCGEPGSTEHGFIYQDGSAHGVYYAAWSEGHPERGVSLAIAVGEWDEGTTAAQRTCVGLEAYEGETEILFRFIDPDASPWPDTELLGPMLSRDTALHHPLTAHLLELCGLVVRYHPAVARFLKVKQPDAPIRSGRN